MIAIVDYGMGNLGSVLNIFRKIGVAACVSSDPRTIESADRIVLPGIGAFASGMRNLEARGLIEVLNRRVLIDRIPVLGACLGLQLMTSGSEEGGASGLGWLPAKTIRFAGSSNKQPLRVPHMGWNHARVLNSHPLFEGLDASARFYFVHSYHLVTAEPTAVVTRTNYGYDFDSAVAVDNVMGVQFHPEKSHRFGQRLLQNFAAMRAVE